MREFERVRDLGIFAVSVYSEEVLFSDKRSPDASFSRRLLFYDVAILKQEYLLPHSQTVSYMIQLPTIYVAIYR